MLDIRLDTTGLDRSIRGLELLTDLQFRYAVADAMTTAAKAGQEKIKADMSRYIDRPTPFTVNSTYVSFANPNKLRAEVGFKQFATKGTPAGKYLSAMSRGGDRSHKRSEGVLRRAGAIGSSQYIVPMREWQGDAFGNVPRGTMSMVLSQLKAYRGDLASLNASNSARSRRKRETAGQFFMSPSRRAILYRAPGAPRSATETAFMVLDDAPNHERRFPIVSILNQEVERVYPQAIRTSLSNELRRAGFSGSY
jgi:hypothetical protein